MMRSRAFPKARHLIAADEARAEPTDPVLTALGRYRSSMSAPGLEVLPALRLSTCMATRRGKWVF
jgi:hypothetical protein